MSADTKNKKLALAICDFLSDSIKNGTINSDDAEGIEVAVQCIAEAFGVDPSDSEQVKQLSIKPASLLSVFDLVLKTQEKVASGNTAVSVEDQKKKAEECKTLANNKMAEKDYIEAIRLYTEAIQLDQQNAVYYANRAAAFSQNHEHERAIDDAKKSVEVDPSYSKGYSRLGLAYLSLGKYQEAIEAYETGLALDPTSQPMKQSLATAKAKLANPVVSAARNNTVEEPAAPRGGFPDAGGMDFGSMLNNPNLMNMASQFMNNPQFSQMMNNPAVAQMAQNLMSNPDALKGLMGDPNVANMAKNFMGGQK